MEFIFQENQWEIKSFIFLSWEGGVKDKTCGLYLDLLKTTTIHPLFHVSLLKKAIDNTIRHQSLMVAIIEDMDFAIEPEKVIKIWEGSNGGKLLIWWKNLLDFDVS